MKKLYPLLVFSLALAASVRVVTIEYPGGTRSGDLKFGPWVYESAKPGGILGKVKDLEIAATKAVLEAPKGKTIAGSEGERIATFEGSVTVTRGRMTAQGPRLVYSESTGFGVLEGPATMHQDPKDKGDAVDVTAARMSFEVDTDISTSEGNVKLRSGRQEGQAGSVYYEEKRGLAIFTDKDQVVLVRKRDDGSLTIRAKEVRSLTDDKRLIATGGVVLVDGDIVTRGDSLYYDDKKGEAIILGRPAVAENAKQGFKRSGAALLHDVNKHRVITYVQPFKLPEADFNKLSR
ncbi:MAG: hypothetical protein M1157_07225 [Deinococcus sp.]|nr:hypothetical protein [Deinococcus sp.]